MTLTLGPFESIGIGFQIEFDISTNASVTLSLIGGQSLLQRRDIEQINSKCSLVEHVIRAAQPKHVMLGKSTLRPNCLTKGLSRSTTNTTTFDNSGLKPEQARLENAFKDETKFQRLFIINFQRKVAGRCGGRGNGSSESGQH